MDIDEQMKWEWEKAEKRRLWEETREADAQARERQLKQARLEAHLKRRGESWLDHTGSLPPSGMMASWQEEYISERAVEEERERERRLAQAEDIAGT